jgi:hypothetical protein
MAYPLPEWPNALGVVWTKKEEHIRKLPLTAHKF